MSSQHHRHNLVLLSMDNSTVSGSSQSEAKVKPSDQSTQKSARLRETGQPASYTFQYPGQTALNMDFFPLLLLFVIHQSKAESSQVIYFEIFEPYHHHDCLRYYEGSRAACLRYILVYRAGCPQISIYCMMWSTLCPIQCLRWLALGLIQFLRQASLITLTLSCWEVYKSTTSF